MVKDMASVIEAAVRSALGSVGIAKIDIEQAPDHNHEDALFVTVTLPPGSPVLSGATVSSAMRAVSDAVLDFGEPRFPYLRLSRADEEPAEEASRSYGSAP